MASFTESSNVYRAVGRAPVNGSLLPLSWNLPHAPSHKEGKLRLRELSSHRVKWKKCDGPQVPMVLYWLGG